MASITDKIRKLLALAESPNENEARLALLNARRLMAEHKLTMADVRDVETEPVIDVDTGLFYTTRSNGWVAGLVTVIADYNCVVGVQSHTYRGQKRLIEIRGLKSDAETAAEMVRYAYEYANTRANQIKQECRKSGMSAREATCEAQSYGTGFVQGLRAAYEAQNRENQQWGLVLVIPQAVQAAAATLRPASQNPYTISARDDNYDTGYSDGYDYGTAKKRLAAATC